MLLCFQSSAVKWLGLGKVAQLRIALGQLSLAVSPIVGRQPGRHTALLLPLLVVASGKVRDAQAFAKMTSYSACASRVLSRKRWS